MAVPSQKPIAHPGRSGGHARMPASAHFSVGHTMIRIRIVLIVLAALLAGGCTSLFEGLQSSVENRVQRMLAGKFTELFTAGIDAVIDSLAAEGGFLDDPLVRILLPPPLGLALGVARDLQRDPKAALLETLLNRAAEHAIPVAGPLLKDMVVNMDTQKLQGLLDAPDASVTAFLKEEGGAAVKAVLVPAVTQQLRADGALELYGELLAAREATARTVPADGAVEVLAPAASDAAPLADAGLTATPGQAVPVAPEQLGDYVAEQAMTGLFKKVAQKELAVRDSVNETLQVPF